MTFFTRTNHFLLRITVLFLIFIINLESQEKELKTRRIFPDKNFLSKINKPALNTFSKTSSSLEDTRLFYVINFAQNKYDTVIAKLKAVNEHSKIWVDTLSLSKNYVSSVEISELSNYLEYGTYEMSKDNTKGILVLINKYFGDPPNVDENRSKERGDGKTNILLTDINDGLDNSKEYLPGYFNYEDVDKAGTVSNKMDLIYLDTNPGIYSSGVRNIRRALPTVAHEFQHLIHWNYDPNESVFMNESMSFLAETFCGFKISLPEECFANTNISLFDWNDTCKTINESRAALFGEYLREQCGDDFIKYLISNSGNNDAGIDSALVLANQKNQSFEKLFTNWAIANYMNDKFMDKRFGYNYKLYNKPIPVKTYKEPNVFSSAVNINNLAPVYIKYTMAESLATIFNFKKNIIIKALEIGNSNFTTYDITTNNYYVQNNLGSLYNDVVFLCINLNKESGESDYIDYTSYGKKAESFAEIAYDDGEPENYGLSGDVGVKRFVRFRIPAGKQLDSIRFGFKTTGKALFHLYKSTDTSIYPIDNIIIPIMITVTDTFPKWTKVDLTPYKIYPEYDIAAGYELLTSDAPHPGIWGDNSNILNRSIMYFPSLSTWNSINTNYLIRAYMSDVVLSVVKKSDVIPDSYKLYQNYPNPFNGTTTICFDLAKRQKVKLKIYDLLGKEVITLADDNFDAGSYSVRWYGKNKYAVNVPTGFYIYCLETSGKSIFRKMIYLK